MLFLCINNNNNNAEYYDSVAIKPHEKHIFTKSLKKKCSAEAVRIIRIVYIYSIPTSCMYTFTQILMCCVINLVCGQNRNYIILFNISLDSKEK